MHAPLPLAALLVGGVLAMPFPTPASTTVPTCVYSPATLARREYAAGSQPYFPTDIPSCVACEPQWSGISSCAKAASAFEDWKNTLYNPLSFIDAIKCSCTDTFSSAFPQCVDCFVQTNQCEQYLGVPSLEANASSVLDGVREVCGLGSALLGGVAASQSSAGLTYTYTAEPSQGFPTTTSIGPGGIDYGSAQGASTGAATAGGAGQGWARALGAALAAAGGLVAGF
ncbi:hypothetical protein JCM3775_000314 [Rhodotorula graminis]